MERVKFPDTTKNMENLYGPTTCFCQYRPLPSLTLECFCYIVLEPGFNIDIILTLRLLMSYIYGAPSKARNANVVYIWTYVWQR